MEAKIMPNNLEAEQSLLGCLLIGGAEVVSYIAKHKDSDFYSRGNRTIFEAMKNLQNQLKPIDFVTLSDELDGMGKLNEVGGVEYLTQLTQVVPSSVHVEYYSNIVKRDALRRDLIRISQDITKDAYEKADINEVIYDAEKKILEFRSDSGKGSLVNIDDALGAAILQMQEIVQNPNANRGLMTGYKQFDNKTNGLHKSDLIILAASPAVGKTSLAMNIVANIVRDPSEKHIAAVFALEMSSIQLAKRILCSVSGVSMQKANSGRLDADSDFTKLWKAKRDLTSQGAIYIDESMETNPTEILSKCRRLKAEKGLDMVMIDYLQLMTGGNGKSPESRQQEIGTISRTMKMMARELDVPVLLLSQINRAGAKRTEDEGGLQLFDLRDSGSIEQDADIVIFLSPDDLGKKQDNNREERLVNLKIEKHRNGPRATIRLKFIGQNVEFKEITEEEYRAIKGMKPLDNEEENATANNNVQEDKQYNEDNAEEQFIDSSFVGLEAPVEEE